MDSENVDKRVTEDDKVRNQHGDKKWIGNRRNKGIM